MKLLEKELIKINRRKLANKITWKKTDKNNKAFIDQ